MVTYTMFRDGARLLAFTAPGTRAVEREVPEGVLGVRCGGGAATVLTREGALLRWRVGAEEFEEVARLALPAGATCADWSDDGRVVIVGTNDTVNFDWTGGVHVWRDGAWRDVPLPDFLCAVTQVRCAVDGAAVGYGYRTSQPWSENGSYGDRMWGAAVIDRDGRAVLEYSDRREHDEHPHVTLAWSAPLGRLIVGTTSVRFGWSAAHVVWTSRVEGSIGLWEYGPLGSGTRVEASAELAGEVAAVEVSACGRWGLVVDASGGCTLIDFVGAGRALVARGVRAVSFADAPVVDWLDADARWRRAPPSALEWEALDVTGELPASARPPR